MLFRSLGTKTIWTSPWTNCDAGASQCDEYALTLSPLDFTMYRQENNSWMVKIDGSAQTWGSKIVPGYPACGKYWYTYNYTNNSIYYDYESPSDPYCPYADHYGYLSNEYYIKNLDTGIDQLKFNDHVYGHYNYDSDAGCTDLSSYIRINYVNQSLYNATTNSTFISTSVFDSSYNVPSVTLSNDNIHLPSSILNRYISGDKDRKSTRLNSSHIPLSRMPSSA